ncbi:MAG: hypothetical protein HYV67_01285 [Candidatus Taylorbacteria bacterium]|nr:hypothetical protein [Candidatus Taylorbacteria bacterium]
MKPKTLISLGLALAFSASLAGTLAHAQAATYSAPADDSTQDLHIDKDGNISVRQAKVMQITGTSFYVRYYVGLAFLRILVKTDAATKVFRRFGDEIDLGQIATGDTLNIEGKIESGADSLSVMAGKLTDFSNQKEITNFQGTIAGTGPTTGSFILTTKNNTITIQTGTTTQIRKGSRIIGLDLVRSGDTVLDVVGTYDHTTKTIDANVVLIYIDKTIFQPRNFQGTLKSMSAGNPPVLTFSAEGKDYTVTLLNGAAVLNKRRQAVSLKRYLEGDAIRVYGAIREAEEPIIDVEVIRNLSLQ